MKNENPKHFVMLITLFVFLFASCDRSGSASNDPGNKSNPGLIGVFYNTLKLTYPKGIIMLDSLYLKWIDSEDYKSGSGAVWNGYLESPATGEVTLQIATNGRIELRIGDVEILAGENRVSQGIQMKKGKKYPVELIFYNDFNDSGTGEFDVKWSWEGNDFMLIGQEYLSYTEKELEDLAWITELDKNNFKPEDYLRAVNARHSIVYYEEGRVGGWPANNGIWSWGDEILVSFSQGYHKSRPHQHNVDEIKGQNRAFARSLDGGETWRLEEDIVLPRRDAIQYTDMKEPVNFKSPGFAFVSNGDKFNVSFDKGKTWSTAYIYPAFNEDFSGHSARTDYVVLDENTLRIFTASEYVGKKGWGTDRAYMIETRDGGKSLEFISWIAETDTLRSVMPSTVKISDDHMITALRRRYDTPKSVNHSLKYNWIDVYETEDGGRTWHFLNKIANTDDGRRNGNPPALVKLSDGTLVVAYGYRGLPYSIRARTSVDYGKTWSKEIIIRDDAIKWDLGYVRMVARPDDKVCMAYYYTTQDKPELHIECTIWDPKDVADY